jgi:hypothetical protein
MEVLLCLIKKMDYRLNLKSSFMLRVVYVCKKLVITSCLFILKPYMDINLEASWLLYILILFNNQMVMQTLV